MLQLAGETGVLVSRDEVADLRGDESRRGFVVFCCCGQGFGFWKQMMTGTAAVAVTVSVVGVCVASMRCLLLSRLGT